VAATLTTVDKNKRKNRAGQIIQSLISGGHLGSGLENDEGWLWLN
jgi:hypothetical protein